MYRELLEEEMKVSDKFTKENFGKQVGEAFPELVKEIVDSPTITTNLMVDVALIGLSGKAITESLRKNEGKEDSFAKAILENTMVFHGPLSMLYWGIQIGRKLERKEIETKKLEELFGEK